MTQKWNLQDIRPAEPRKRRTPSSEPASLDISSNPRPAPREVNRDSTPNIVIEDGTKKARNRLVTSVVLFFVIVGSAVLLSIIFGRTELTVYPESREPNVSAEFTAYPDRRAGELSYEIMTLEATGEAQVKASGQVQVEELATGIIEISKSTPGAERLIKNTRFRTSDGLVFRIEESVVIPGAVKDESGQLVPGTIQAKVFADDVGENYNLTAGKTFDIPGFQESGLTELYNAIKAKNPEAFSGGFKGPQFKIDEQELATARQALQVSLRDGLLLRIDAEKPANFIAFKEAVAITYNQLPAVEYGGDLVTIREQAILQIPMFEATNFGSFLAQETVATYDGNPVRVEDPSVLSFKYSSSSISSMVIANEPSLTFTLTGKPLLVWEYDVEKLRKDFAGLPKSALKLSGSSDRGILGAYPGIRAAKAHITPFWKLHFPEDPAEITIIESLDYSELE